MTSAKTIKEQLRSGKLLITVGLIDIFVTLIGNLGLVSYSMDATTINTHLINSSILVLIGIILWWRNRKHS